MNEASWFYVFDADSSLWLHDGGDWGRYSGAAEFNSYNEAREAAEEQIKGGLKSAVIVLADHGSVEAA